MMNPEFWIREPDAADPFPELSFWNLTLETFLGAPMETKASFLGHPIHQMMIVLPLGLLATAASFDLIASGTRNRRMARSNHYVLSAGLLTAAASAVPGAIDFWDLPWNTRAKKIGLLHGIGNLVVTSLFAASWARRRRNPSRVDGTAVMLSSSGALLALVTGWLGGELVDRLGIGVHEGANLNAPNSLSVKSAQPELRIAG
jgi:uncharacterized membrane protein